MESDKCDFQDDLEIEYNLLFYDVKSRGVSVDEFNNQIEMLWVTFC